MMMLKEYVSFFFEFPCEVPGQWQVLDLCQAIFDALSDINERRVDYGSMPS